ncbi:hypothetical protein E2C01_032632 [Portunus trituberculatus]|uniref:Uncharacterized protein n=1 Tax=Portunus trituberculatus TaxID=210409 RepID=A0A5B7EY07_PORTR|nr:hypothetical protein [Portunus trituberculatus]
MGRTSGGGCVSDVVGRAGWLAGRGITINYFRHGRPLNLNVASPRPRNDAPLAQKDRKSEGQCCEYSPEEPRVWLNEGRLCGASTRRHFITLSVVCFRLRHAASLWLRRGKGGGGLPGDYSSSPRLKYTPREER